MPGICRHLTDVDTSSLTQSEMTTLTVKYRVYMFSFSLYTGYRDDLSLLRNILTVKKTYKFVITHFFLLHKLLVLEMLFFPLRITARTLCITFNNLYFSYNNHITSWICRRQFSFTNTNYTFLFKMTDKKHCTPHLFSLDLKQFNCK